MNYLFGPSWNIAVLQNKRCLVKIELASNLLYMPNSMIRPKIAEEKYVRQSIWKVDFSFIFHKNPIVDFSDEIST